MAINFLFILFLVFIPVSLRLMLIPDPTIRATGATLFPVNVGLLLLSAILANVIIIRQSKEIPGEVKRDLKRGLAVFPLMLALFILSLFIPVHITLQMVVFALALPAFVGDLSFRFICWWLIIISVQVFSSVVGYIQEKRARGSEEEVSTSEEWRRTLTNKARTISDAAYGLAIALSAFSLTTYAIGGMGDIVLMLLYFLLPFFLILLWWIELYRCIGLVSVFNALLLAVNLLLIFFITLLPFSMQLVLSSDIMARSLGMTLFPINMLCASLVASVVVVLSLRRRTVDIPKDDLLELQRLVVVGPIFAAFFLISLLFPPIAVVPPPLSDILPPPLNTLPFRVVIWWLSFLAFFFVGGIMEFVTERIARREGSLQRLVKAKPDST
ncbi:MAG: hypothetical protein ACFFCO_01770 [Promethearchaeota archaeon]